MMTSNDIRSAFLEFFKSKGHTIVKSDSVVPKDDPTVLFTTAGMQQFKRQFLGDVTDYRRAASSQKCLRTDDLDKVGQTDFHHTFFEMLGNFSFGDYFKKDAIAWAWEFLTQTLRIPADKLWVSIYKDDTEAEKIWLNDIKIPKSRFVRLGDKSNFWPSEAKAKGPNGPCGPCSEIFYDYGVNPDCKLGDKCNPDCDCGRFSEIWNLVFTQFNRKEGGELEPLPNKNIDTGMGLERLVAVMQGKTNNFETDLFVPIIEAIDKETNRCGYSLGVYKKRVIADHIRAIVFAIDDGIIPSNEGRGYVVKKLIIDATDLMIPHGKSGARLWKPVQIIEKIMQAPYVEKIKDHHFIAQTMQRVQEAYLATRDKRIPELKNEITQAQTLPEKKRVAALGEIFFNYRDRYGLTMPTIVSTAETFGLSDELLVSTIKASEKHMKKQQERSRASSKMAGDVFVGAELNLSGLAKTEFDGHEKTKGPGKIIRLFKDNQEVNEAKKPDAVKIILDKTPFYAESGGQVGDTGEIVAGKAKVHIDNTVKIGDIFIHAGQVVDGTIKSNETVEAAVDECRRLAIMRNHTATHLLQAGLRKVLGKHVRQQGSAVDEGRLRFDFTHPQALTPEQVRDVEEFVYQAILANKPVIKQELILSEAREQGALAFFEEKYSDTVRMVTIEGTSKELCGGTHLDYTGQIGLMKITGEAAIAQGIRRIEAITGDEALKWVNRKQKELDKIAKTLQVPAELVCHHVQALIKRMKQEKKELGKYRLEAIKNHLNEIIDKADVVNGAKIITHIFDDVDIGLLRNISDLIKQKAKSAVILLGALSNDNAAVLAAVSDDLVKKGIRANDLIEKINPTINGSGGGRPNMAQAGSKNTNKKNLDQALRQAGDLVKEKSKG